MQCATGTLPDGIGRIVGARRRQASSWERVNPVDSPGQRGIGSGPIITGNETSSFTSMRPPPRRRREATEAMGTGY